MVIFVIFLVGFEGDVLVGKDEFGIYYVGIFEGWFGEYWWNIRIFVFFIIIFFVFVLLIFFKWIGKYLCFIFF